MDKKLKIISVILSVIIILVILTSVVLIYSSDSKQANITANNINTQKESSFPNLMNNIRDLPRFKTIPQNLKVVDYVEYHSHGEYRLGYAIGVLEQNLAAGPMSSCTEQSLLLSSATEDDRNIGKPPLTIIPLRDIDTYIVLKR